MKTHNEHEMIEAGGDYWYRYTPCEGHPTASGRYILRTLKSDKNYMRWHAGNRPDAVRMLLDRIFQLTCIHSVLHKLDGWQIARWILPPAVTTHDAEYTPTPEEKQTMRALDYVMDMRCRYDEHGNIPPEQLRRLGGDDGLFMTFLNTYAEQHGYKLYPPDAVGEWPYLDLIAGRE